MDKGEPFNWLSVSAFRRLSPLEKEAYLREIVAHLADHISTQPRPKSRPRVARTSSRKRD